MHWLEAVNLNVIFCRSFVERSQNFQRTSFSSQGARGCEQFDITIPGLQLRRENLHQVFTRCQSETVQNQKDGERKNNKFPYSQGTNRNR